MKNDLGIEEKDYALVNGFWTCNQRWVIVQC